MRPTVEKDARGLLEFEDVDKSFRAAGPSRRPGLRSRVQAVDGVTFAVERGEAMGLIGGSGSGKSTIARLAVGLIRPDRGHIRLEGRDIARARERELRLVRRWVHLIFQDPYDSLSPRMRTTDLVTEPLVIQGIGNGERRSTALKALEEAGLDPAEEFADRFPHQLSGGQRQRVALARALVQRPRLIIADEPTSMLDVSLRKGLLSAMDGLRTRHGITFLFITHDLALAANFCQRLVVMCQGRIVETGATDQLVAAPQHPYTHELMKAVRDLEPAHWR